MQTLDARFLQLSPTVSCDRGLLAAELGLPKEPEHFASDIHGEYTAFSHILRNGCGQVRRSIAEVFGDRLGDEARKRLATLIYYPRERIPIELAAAPEPDLWRAKVTSLIAALLRHLATDYPRYRVYELAIGSISPQDIDALLAYDIPVSKGADMSAPPAENGTTASSGAAGTVAATASATTAAVGAVASSDALIESACTLISRLCIGHLHVVGDIYDRGPSPHAIMDMLEHYPSLDIQWGNHDIVWMGASQGQRGCIAHVVRNCARYGNLDILTGSYGMDLAPLASFADTAYAGDPCAAFALKVDPGLSPEALARTMRIQKAMAILQFKVEAALSNEHPEFGLENRKLLHTIDYERRTFTVDGVEYEMTDTHLPTVNPADPYALTTGEEEVMRHLQRQFTGCARLQRHMRVLLEHGSLYKVCNGNLLLHACVPLNADGSLKEVDVYGSICKGKALYDAMQEWVYQGFMAADPVLRKRGCDMMWYLWLGQGSPLFAKDKMATFEIYMATDKAARKETKNAFYQLFGKPQVYDAIFEDFGLDPQKAHIICGHVPVKAKKGEDPVKADGKVICIDGGFSAAYQPTTGLAGYTLAYRADNLTLYAHAPLASRQAAIDGVDIVSTPRVIERYDPPLTVGDTNEGAAIRRRIAELEG